MTLIKQTTAQLKSGSSSVTAVRPKGPLATRVVELMDGRKMLVMRQATLKAAVQAGEASLRNTRPALKWQVKCHELADG